MNQNPLLYLIKTGWRYAGSYRLAMLGYVGLFVVAQAITLCDPYVIGKLLNTVQAGIGHGPGARMEILHAIYFYLAFYLALKISFWLFHGPARVIERLVAFNIKANYKSKLFGVLMQLPVQWHREHHSGESIDKINRATTALSDFFGDSFGVFCPLLSLLGIEIVLYNFMPFAFWISVVTTAVAFGIIFLLDKALYRQYGSLNKFENSVATVVHDYVTNVISIIALRLEKRVLQKVKRTLDAGFKLVGVNMTMGELKWCVTTILIAIMTVAVMAIYAYNIVVGGHKFQSGTFVMLFEYLRRIGESFYALATVYGSIVRKAADVHGADSILDASFTHQYGKKKMFLPVLWRKLKIKNLYFTYQDEKLRMHHLENINVDLAKGRSIALVGRSGSGKSTFLSLLRGLQTAHRAEVECDGVKLQHGLRHLASQTTLMPQDPEIFADTIRFNVTCGLEADDAEIMAVIRAARFETVLARLPKGLDTNVAEKGVNLSGGEKQRLALARGMYFAKDSDIVLLDEPTSSVDGDNERKIYGRMLKSFKDKCIVSSVHRLHLLDQFDTIYVFEDGKIVESGDFDTLLRNRGLLAHMWRQYQVSDQPAAAQADYVSVGNVITLRDRAN
jgi:ABC-type multidrug transport system fused ATPase/permease subunit